MGNRRVALAVRRNHAIRSGSRCSSVAFVYGAASKGPERMSCLSSRYSTSAAYSPVTSSDEVLNRFRIRPACSLPTSARIFGWRVAGGIVPAPDVDELALPFGGGEVELSPGRRDHAGVLGAVVIPEQPDMEYRSAGSHRGTGRRHDGGRRQGICRTGIPAPYT